MPLFTDLGIAPPDAILNTALRFKADTHPEKINVGIGAYRDDNGKPVVLSVVKKVEEEITAEIGINEFKEYAPVDGNPALKECTQKLLFGDSAAVQSKRIASAQALSGTGSLRVTGEFITTYLPKSAHTIHVSAPTWGNHKAIFTKANMTVKEYPYWKESTRGLDFEGMIAAWEAAEEGNCILLHAIAHNPTGVDPTKEQWDKMVEVIKAKKLIPIVDNAYQGFATGDLENDSYSTRLFEKHGLEFFVCQSFAKNMGLYGERFGMVHCVCDNARDAEAVTSQLKLVIRPMYSSPPIHGAVLVHRILSNPANYAQWKKEVEMMATRIGEMRILLRKGLVEKNTPGNWNHITDQIGMFSFTGLTKPQCERLIEKHHVYLLLTGRISMAGLNTKNIDYFVNAIDEVVKNA